MEKHGKKKHENLHVSLYDAKYYVILSYYLSSTLDLNYYLGNF